MKYNHRMHRLFMRIFLVCVLLVAIPVQGFAAVMMLGCEMTQSSVSDPTIQTVVDHDHHSHGGHHDHSSVAMADTSHDELHSMNSDQHESHVKHKSCSSGCASVVTDDVMPQMISSPNNRTDFTYVLSLHLPPVLAGLDRPPR